MRIFDFEPADYTQQYADQEWVHVKDGIAPEFLEYLRGLVAYRLAEASLDHPAIWGEETRGPFQFPRDAHFPDEVFDVAAAVCGLRREAMALSERHIQICEQNANPEPTARKDPYSSQVSIGFSIEIPAQSRLVLYPYEHRETNPFISAAALRRHLRSYEQPDVVLRNARAVELADRPGDVVMFASSNTWHKRRNSASAVSLYVTVNDFDCGAVGEDAARPCSSRRHNHLGRKLELQHAPYMLRATLFEELASTSGHRRDRITKGASPPLRHGILHLT